MKRVAIYHRVSKDDGSQDETKMLELLREDCQRNAWHIVGEFVERESGRKGRAGRGEFDKLLKLAERRGCDFVYFYALDRFSREGLKPTLAHLQTLEMFGIGFKSKLEPYLDTENELIRHILVSLISYIAKFESDRTSRRIKDSLSKAKAKGVQLGRRSKFEEVKDRLEPMIALGLTDYRIGKRLKLKPDTVKVYRARLQDSVIANNGALFTDS
jgi:DNA invertase Pin-like site-specific DNA recombinase